MNTLDELLYYCNEPEPVGALLLSGEWGCGKTYLINHELKSALQAKAIVLRISLFGITLPDEIHTSIKNAWVEEYIKLKGLGEMAEKISKGKKLLSKMHFLPESIRGIGTTEVADFFQISCKMEGMNVILVFDDLERCRMNSVDVLGIINDYCENQRYHTIIVANQEKIKNRLDPTPITGEVQYYSCDSRSSDFPEKKAKITIDVPQGQHEGDLAFSEMKEKIIQRTVCYLPDYVKIVHAVINNLQYDSEEYKTFISSCEDGLLNLFAPDRDEFKSSVIAADYLSEERNENVLSAVPHNIRSLKCAIRDFYRIYQLLKDNQINNAENWFYSFASYLIAFKADIVGDDPYGGLFSDEVVRKLYPAFRDEYMFSAAKKWIRQGIWDKCHFEKEIEHLKIRETTESPISILKAMRIADIDESIIVEAFPQLLDMAYSGELSLDEYVLLIQNCAWARGNAYVFPVAIEWKLVRDGISTQIDKLKKEIPNNQILYRIIEKSQRDYFTADEWETYSLISGFALSNELMYLKNKNIYIDQVQKLGSSSFIHIQNKRFNCFDADMATATAKAFEKESTAGKNEFVSYFTNVWTRNISSSEIKVEDSINGFCSLMAELQVLLSRINTGKRTFSVIHTERFIHEINVLIENLRSRLPKISDNSNNPSESTEPDGTEDTAEVTTERTTVDTDIDNAKGITEKLDKDIADHIQEPSHDTDEDD